MEDECGYEEEDEDDFFQIFIILNFSIFNFSNKLFFLFFLFAR